MHIRLTFEIPLLAIVGPDSLCFTTELDEATASIDLHQLEPHGKWSCAVTMEREPPPKVAAFLLAIADGSLRPEVDWERFGSRGGELLGPPAYRDFVDKIQPDLTALARRTVSLLQWRLGIRGNHQTLTGGSRPYWSIDGSEFRALPGVAHVTDEYLCVARSVDEVLRNDVESLVRTNASQPLGHELLQEAASLRSTNPRGAFVLAIIAAEVGLKECIADLIPEAEWLVFNMPMPPLSRILDDLLPNLPSKCAYSAELVPPKLFETIKKAGICETKSCIAGTIRRSPRNSARFCLQSEICFGCSTTFEAVHGQLVTLA